MVSNNYVRWIWDLKIYGVADAIEKGFETGVAVTLGGLFGSLGEPS